MLWGCNEAVATQGLLFPCAGTFVDLSRWVWGFRSADDCRLDAGVANRGSGAGMIGAFRRLFLIAVTDNFKHLDHQY